MCLLLPKILCRKQVAPDADWHKPPPDAVEEVCAYVHVREGVYATFLGKRLCMQVILDLNVLAEGKPHCGMGRLNALIF